MEPISVRAAPENTPGDLVRRTRRAKGMTLCQLGQLTGYSTAQVSRYERGISPLTDVMVLRRFATALGIPPQDLGLTEPPRHSAATGHYPRLPAPTVEIPGHEDGEDAVRRRKLLANLAITAAAAAGAPITSTSPSSSAQARPGELLVAGLRDAMLGLGTSPPGLSPDHLPGELARAVAHFNASSYGSLAVRLPRLIRAGHQAGAEYHAVLARCYLLATRALIKVDEPQLGWMAADRARQLALANGAPLDVAEAARQQAVLARQAGWHDQSLTLALAAADDPALREAGSVGLAQRGLLIQCAAYTVAHQRDQEGMRQLTKEAAAIAEELGGTRLRAYGGFGSATVQLHLISAEDRVGDPSAAIAAADKLAPLALPSIERRARYHVDVATAYARLGRRDKCIEALLAAEHEASEETRARPTVKTLISGLLVSGRTTPELRGLAARAGVLIR
ncbi:helix-turn-helix transcriptional regulator [Streptomyces hygroscopicus]|uniref:helix-turn-helix domain-containing protein n=1 Tax=Streptomyces hygroscopicus TaxID=1912 RepID=UPI0009A0028F|nr:helix-turn-helix transcriptional regulator [Streptomyces hygroscopicus]